MIQYIFLTLTFTAHQTFGGSCNYGVKEYSVLSDSFTAGFGFVDSYCQNVLSADEGTINFEFKCNYTGNYTYVGVIATYASDGMSPLII